MKTDLIFHLSLFLDNEAHSCFMGLGGVTPLYGYSMWGGQGEGLRPKLKLMGIQKLHASSFSL